MFQINYIMAQDDINYLQNTKEGLLSFSWENIVSAHGTAMDLNGEYLGFYVNIYLLILCLSKVSNKNSCDTLTSFIYKI